MAECKFYELDKLAKEEHEQWIATIPESDIRAMEEMMYEVEEDYSDPCEKCREFCKHYSSGKGFPGEYVDYCAAPGNEHIIRVETNISEVI